MIQNASTEINPARRRNKSLLALGGVVALAAVGTTLYWLRYASHFVSTNNAYTSVEVAAITPAVGGTIAEVRVKDTQAVNRGDILVVLDPIDARLAVAQAAAEVDRAVRRVESCIANDGSLAAQIQARDADWQHAGAQLEAAQSDAVRAKVDLDRRQALLASGSVSGDEVTRARNAYDAAAANLTGLRALVVQVGANRRSAVAARDANSALIRNTSVASNPEVLVAKARFDQANVDLQRTVIRAPMAGVVAKRQAQPGQRVQAGVALMALVPVGEMHVEANFKEVQLKHVQVGQPVRLSADLYGDSLVYHGIVEGFSGGSGSAFSAIPAQNATGNWIKVVQRLPVRIKLDPAELQANPLKVGLSMSAEIDTRTRGTGAGLVAAVAPRSGDDRAGSSR